MSKHTSRKNSILSENCAKMEEFSTHLTPVLINSLIFLSTTITFVVFEFTTIKAKTNGFFCNDLSILFAYKEDTISTEMLILINVIVSMSVIIVVEQIVTFETRSLEIFSTRDQHWLPRLCQSNHLWPIRAIKVMLLLTWYIMANTILTDAMKVTVGRLRPHFISVCNPNVTCSSSNTTYITNYGCQSSTAKDENDARLSFPSGHASMSATVMGFVMVYVQLRCNPSRNIVLLKPILHLAMLILAMWIAMTRVSDYQHHMSDVLFGFLLGTIIGIFGGLHATKGTDMLSISKDDFGESHVLLNRCNEPCSYDSKALNIKSSNQHESFSRIKGSNGHVNDLECGK